MVNLTHCMCGCIYEEVVCPLCNKVTEKDRINLLETNLTKAEKEIKRLRTILTYHSLYTFCVNKLKEKKNDKLLTR
jgi:hypothetical protein